MKKYILAALALTACGDFSDSTENTELGRTSQSILSDDQFGVTSTDFFQCSPGNVGGTTTCYYPPGFGDGSPALLDGVPQQWRVCFDWATFDGSIGVPGSQAERAWNTTNYVLDEYEWNGAWATFVNCSSGNPNLRVRGNEFANTGNFGASDIRRYVKPVCNNSSLLSESPSLTGTHRYCTNWTINIAIDRIDAYLAPGSDDNLWLVDHAFGWGIAAAIIGAGVHSEDNTVWSHWSVTPLEKYGLRPREYCRAAARYDNAGGANYNIVTKQDNACD